MVEAQTIPIEVAYALPEEQVIIPLQVVPGTTAEMAVLESGILERFHDIDLNKQKIGIFGKVVKKDTPLHEHDRVEIYRPLLADPKAARKERAAKSA